MRVVPRVEDYPSRNIIICDVPGLFCVHSSEQQQNAETELAKFIWSGMYMHFGMGGMPISHRQELRKQRIACIASRFVACSAERPRGQKTFRKE